MQKEEFIEKLKNDSLHGDVAGLIRPERNYYSNDVWDIIKKSHHSIFIEIEARSKRQIVNKTHRSLNEKHF